jgi:hypothetical protein
MNYKHIPKQITLTFLIVGVVVTLTGFAADSVPKGWFKAGSHPQNYEMSVDTAVKHNGKSSAYIKFIGDKAEGFGTLMQAFKADDYRSKRVRMSAWMKTENTDSAQLWMRVDGEKRMLGFDNMDNRGVKGTTEWKRYEITLDVPENTVNIAFGALVNGKGQAWMDDFQFEVVGKDVPTTNMLPPEEMNKEQEQKQPVNLNFEG